MNKKIVLKSISGVLLCTMITYTTPLFAFTKDETVYSKLDSNGNVYNTIVSDHIKNDEQSNSINDVSDLLNIINTGSDETFEQNGSNIIWNANGKDVYYQGDSDKKLPIQCDIKYELNDEFISPSDIVGKSGKVKITIKYVNNDSHVVSVNGKNETMYTPFVVVCGTVIDNECNRNIKVTNGKVIDNGNKTAVVALSFPGLQDSLNISNDKINLPSTIEITMDSTDFKMSNIMTYATSKILEEDVDFSDFDKIFSQVNSLQSASKQLESGAVSLSSGSSSLKAGAKTVSDGSKAISTNLSTLSENLGNLKTGASALKAGKDELVKGVQGFMSNIDVSDFKNQSNEIAKLEQLISANISVRDGLIMENKSLNASLASGTLSPEDEVSTRAKISSNTSLIGLLSSNIDVNNSTLSLLKASDVSSMQQLQTGLYTLQSALDAFDAGIDSIYDGASKLQTGSGVLASKCSELSQGAETLYHGTVQISDGANELANGMTKFNKDGIQKIASLVNGNLKTFETRLDKLQDLSRDYDNFSGLNDSDVGDVKFIMIVDSLDKNSSKKPDMIIENNNRIDDKKDDE